MPDDAPKKSGYGLFSPEEIEKELMKNFPIFKDQLFARKILQLDTKVREYYDKLGKFGGYFKDFLQIFGIDSDQHKGLRDIEKILGKDPVKVGDKVVDPSKFKEILGAYREFQASLSDKEEYEDPIYGIGRRLGSELITLIYDIPGVNPALMDSYLHDVLGVVIPFGIRALLIKPYRNEKTDDKKLKPKISPLKRTGDVMQVNANFPEGSPFGYVKPKGLGELKVCKFVVGIMEGALSNILSARGEAESWQYSVTETECKLEGGESCNFVIKAEPAKFEFLKFLVVNKTGIPVYSYGFTDELDHERFMVSGAFKLSEETQKIIIHDPKHLPKTGEFSYHLVQGYKACRRQGEDYTSYVMGILPDKFWNILAPVNNKCMQLIEPCLYEIEPEPGKCYREGELEEQFPELNLRARIEEVLNTRITPYTTLKRTGKDVSSKYMDLHRFVSELDGKKSLMQIFTPMNIRMNNAIEFAYFAWGNNYAEVVGTK